MNPSPTPREGKWSDIESKHAERCVNMAEANKEDKTVEDSCILQFEGVQKTGYARTFYNGKFWLAHRLAYFLEHGSIPKGKLICHHCDIRNCINPKHLYAGTYKTNSDDCLSRGRHMTQACPERHVHGERVNTAKLQASDIPKIFKLKKSGRFHYVIAKIFGVSRTTINDVLWRKSWKHVKV